MDDIELKLAAVSIPFLFLLFVLAKIDAPEKKVFYEYVDLSDKEGIAEKCYKSSGGLFCDLEDDSKIQVKQYKKIEEEIKEGE